MDLGAGFFVDLSFFDGCNLLGVLLLGTLLSERAEGLDVGVMDGRWAENGLDDVDDDGFAK